MLSHSMRKIHIAHLLGGGQFCGGGQYIIKIMEGLEGDHFKFNLLSLKEGPLAAEAKRRGLPVYILEKKRTADPISVLKTVRYLRSECIDLIHTHSANSNLYGILASFFCRDCLPIVTLHAYYKDVHSDVLTTRNLLHAAYKLDLFLIGRACRVITVSNSIKERIVADGVQADRITVIPNGIDIEAYRKQADRQSVREEFGIRPESILVGTAGRLSFVKNQALFLKAAARLINQGKDIHLILFGDGPEEENLRRLAADLGLISRIIFAGWRSDIARCLSGLDIFVLSSRSEVAPFVLLESMALEIPFVSTNVGGVSEMIEPEQSGLLTENENVEQMAEVILRLAEDPVYRKMIGRRGREFVETHFSQESMFRATSDIYLAAYREKMGIS